MWCSSRRWTEDDGTPQRGQDGLDAVAVNAKSTYACVTMTFVRCSARMGERSLVINGWSVCTSSFVIPRCSRLRSIVTHHDDAPGCRDERWMGPDDGTAPHVSSGGALSVVPGMRCLFNLPGRFVAQGRVYMMLVVILDFGHFSRNQRALDVPASALWTPGLGSLRTDDSRSARNQQGMG